MEAMMPQPGHLPIQKPGWGPQGHPATRETEAQRGKDPCPCPWAALPLPRTSHLGQSSWACGNPVPSISCRMLLKGPAILVFVESEELRQDLPVFSERKDKRAMRLA